MPKHPGEVVQRTGTPIEQWVGEGRNQAKFVTRAELISVLNIYQRSAASRRWYRRLWRWAMARLQGYQGVAASAWERVTGKVASTEKLRQAVK